jgi:hypothetical protein
VLGIFAARETEAGREHVNKSQAQAFDVADKRDFHRPIQTGFQTHDEAFNYCILSRKAPH